MTSPIKSNRFAELDVVRGLAAMAVVYYHYIYRYPAAFSNGVEASILHWSVPGVPEKYLGLIPVYIFFMISGFVIFWTIEKSSTAASFAFSRFSRLYPAYWVAVIMSSVAITIYPIAYDSGVTLGRWVANMTMLQALFSVSDIDGVYWSLFIELIFYFWVFLAKRQGWLETHEKKLLIWMLAVVAYGVFDAKSNPVPAPIVYGLLLEYGHCFVIGIVSYRIWKDRQLSRYGVALIALAIIATWERYPPVVAAMLCVATTLFLLLAMRRMGWIVSAPLMWLGGISYPLYLIHQNIGYIVMEELRLPSIIEILIAMAVSLGLASWITFGIEKPLRSRLRVWWSRQQFGGDVTTVVPDKQ